MVLHDKFRSTSALFETTTYKTEEGQVVIRIC